MLAILTSHPIQYQAPLWRALAASGKTPFAVWFLTNQGITDRVDREFGESFQWDLDLLADYPHEFLDVKQPWDMSKFLGVRLNESLADRMRSNGVRALWVEGWRYLAFWTALEQAKRVGAEVWMRGETNDLRRRRPGVKSVVRQVLLKKHLSRVDRFLCIGTANRRFYRSFGVADRRLYSAPYCVENNRFIAQGDAARNNRRELRERWGIPENAYCLLFCGKFIDKKRPLDIVKAAALLADRMDSTRPLHLLFVGNGALGESLRAACNVAFDVDPQQADVRHDAATHDEVRPRASFIGFLNQSEIAQAYAAADLLVLPSNSGETWGLVVNEAMAAGCPAVVSDQCGCAEDLAAPLEGRLVFRSGDVGDLARAIAFAIDARLELDKVREIVDSHHLRHTVNVVDDLYAEAIQNDAAKPRRWPPSTA